MIRSIALRHQKTNKCCLYHSPVGAAGTDGFIIEAFCLCPAFLSLHSWIKDVFCILILTIIFEGFDSNDGERKRKRKQRGQDKDTAEGRANHEWHKDFSVRAF